MTLISAYIEKAIHPGEKSGGEMSGYRRDGNAGGVCSEEGGSWAKRC